MVLSVLPNGYSACEISVVIYLPVPKKVNFKAFYGTQNACFGAFYGAKNIKFCIFAVETQSFT